MFVRSSGSHEMRSQSMGDNPYVLTPGLEGKSYRTGGSVSFHPPTYLRSSARRSARLHAVRGLSIKPALKRSMRCCRSWELEIRSRKKRLAYRRLRVRGRELQLLIGRYLFHLQDVCWRERGQNLFQDLRREIRYRDGLHHQLDAQWCGLESLGGWVAVKRNPASIAIGTRTLLPAPAVSGVSAQLPSGSDDVVTGSSRTYRTRWQTGAPPPAHGCRSRQISIFPSGTMAFLGDLVCYSLLIQCPLLHGDGGTIWLLRRLFLTRISKFEVKYSEHQSHPDCDDH